MNWFDHVLRCDEAIDFEGDILNIIPIADYKAPPYGVFAQQFKELSKDTIHIDEPVDKIGWHKPPIEIPFTETKMGQDFKAVCDELKSLMAKANESGEPMITGCQSADTRGPPVIVIDSLAFLSDTKEDK